MEKVENQADNQEKSIEVVVADKKRTGK